MTLWAYVWNVELFELWFADFLGFPYLIAMEKVSRLGCVNVALPTVLMNMGTIALCVVGVMTNFCAIIGFGTLL